MFRRCITSLVLLGFNVSQLAAAPHLHGSVSPDEQHRHDAHPHIHLGFGGHPHARSEHHAPLGPGDGINGDGINGDGINGDGINRDVRSGNEHDADAIYLPGAGAPALGSDRSQALQQGDLASPDRFGAQSISDVNDKASKAFPWRPPDDDPPACPVFLKLRTLRI